jgi:AbrB family looped-hinge helix DNA binding protein
MEVEEREIQQGGRVKIPKNLREKFGLEEGTKVKFRAKGNKIEIEPPRRLTSLIGIIREGVPSDDPKKIAREYAKSKIMKEVE